MSSRGASPAIVTLVVFLALILVVVFFWRVFFYYRQITAGEVPDLPQFSSQFSSGGQSSGGEGKVADVATTDDPSQGHADAKLTVVEFLDYQCPFCGAVSGTVREMMGKYGSQVRFVLRDFPVTELHPQAVLAAEAAGCAEVQGKFWPMHDRLFAAAGVLLRADLDRMAVQSGLDESAFKVCMDTHQRLDEVEEDRLAGLAAGVEGTPTFFFNGNKVEGAIPADAFDALIRSFLTP